jgi:hypothetical protein
MPDVKRYLEEALKSGGKNKDEMVEIKKELMEALLQHKYSLEDLFNLVSSGVTFLLELKKESQVP